jgi:hypothetical protein
MNYIDLKTFTEKLQTELRTYRPEWDSRIDPEATPTSAVLWANEYMLQVDLTKNHIEHGQKFDQVRMVIIRDPRDSFSEATWSEESKEVLKTTIWQSVESNSEVCWAGEGGTELTIQQVFGTIRSQFCDAVEAGV